MRIPVYTSWFVEELPEPKRSAVMRQSLWPAITSVLDGEPEKRPTLLDKLNKTPQLLRELVDRSDLLEALILGPGETKERKPKPEFFGMLKESEPSLFAKLKENSGLYDRVKDLTELLQELMETPELLEILDLEDELTSRLRVDGKSFKGVLNIPGLLEKLMKKPEQVWSWFYPTSREYWWEHPEMLEAREYASWEDISGKYPWLQEFIANRYNIDICVEAFKKSPNETTIGLSEFADLFFCTEVAYRWLARIYEHPVRYIDRPSEQELKKISPYIHDFASEASIRPAWQDLCRAIGDFCLRVQCPSVTYDPCADIANLRHYVVSGNLLSREIYLQRQIDTLKDQLVDQQRVITSLSFRHLLEALPGPKTEGNIGNTQHWQKFWIEAWEKAQNQSSSDSGSSSAHPLASLVQNPDQRSKAKMKAAGNRLYSTLSDIIHKYNGEFLVDNNWYPQEHSILYAIAPTSPRDMDGDIDWQKEKGRYGFFSDTIAKHKDHAKTEEGDTGSKEDLLESINFPMLADLFDEETGSTSQSLMHQLKTLSRFFTQMMKGLVFNSCSGPFLSFTVFAVVIIVYALAKDRIKTLFPT